VRVRAFIVLVAVVAVMGGCSAVSRTPLETPGIAPSLIPSDIDPDRRAGFLDDPPDADHPLPPAVAETFGVDDASARYQGELTGEAVYLYVVDPDDVGMLTFEVDDPGMAGAGTAAGNSAFGLSVADGKLLVQYLPQGTADIPDGWIALSSWVAWREL